MRLLQRNCTSTIVRQPRNKRAGSVGRNGKTGFCFALPFLAGFVIFYVYPFLVMAKNSFTLGAGGHLFVGMENYIELWDNALFRLAAGNTLLYVGIGVPLLLAVSVFLSVAFYRAVSKTKWLRLSFVFPMVMPVSATVVMIDSFLQGMQPDMGQLLLLFIWKNVGYNMVLLFAGLAMIPKEYYESARLDGASGAKNFRYITLPLLLPVLFLVFLVSVLDIFKSFREVLLIGGDAPEKDIYMIQNFVNRNFENLNFQRLCIAMMFICIAVFTMIGVVYGIYRILEKKYT